MLSQLFHHSLVGEDLLHSGLGVVEVAFNGADGNVVSFLGGHLTLLHLADPVLGIEHHHFGAGHVFEALQSRFAGVPAGGHQNDDLLACRRFFGGGSEQIGQNL